jgi:hypothetical protein
LNEHAPPFTSPLAQLLADDFDADGWMDLAAIHSWDWGALGVLRNGGGLF